MAVDAAREATRSQAIVTTRTSLLAALAGVGAIVTIVINYRNSTIAAATLATTNDTFRITERGHLVGRYTKAIEQLGDQASLAIRLGGVYALQQFAVETDRVEDQVTVVEVLSAFVRTSLPRRMDELVEDSAADRNRAQNPTRQPVELQPDVLAAISALAQLPGRTEIRADFSGADFTGLRLTQARLANGDLSGAELPGVDLRDADLERINLRGADLRAAILAGARLCGAKLSGTDLRDADCRGANFRDTVLLAAERNADRVLSKGDGRFDGVVYHRDDILVTDCTRADLRGVDLRDANLTSANLSWAKLGRADLRDATLERTDLNRTSLDRGQLSALQRASARNVPDERGQLSIDDIGGGVHDEE